MRGGGGPLAIGYVSRTVSYPTIYHCFTLKVDPGFTAGGNAGVKWGFSWTPESGKAKSSYYLNLFQGSTGRMGLNIESAGGILNRNTRTRFSWFDHMGEWHQFEVLSVANTQGMANGIIRYWVDGVLDYEHRNVKFFLDEATARGWNRFTVTGTYGGGIKPVPATLTAWLDHYRISGAETRR
jgi:hypothetical protein